MLSPEVWQFPPPKSGRRARTASEENLRREIHDHNFYHNIFVLCADTKQDIPHQFVDLFEDSSYYKLSDCKLNELLKIGFVEGYILKGSLSCLSIGKDASIENVVAITSQEGLTLMLDTQSYQSLGIQGNQFRRLNGETAYYININLTDGTFKSQKKFYNRVHTRLECFESFTFILRWEPHDEQICSSSIAKYLVERGLHVETCTPRLATRRQLAPQIPRPDIQYVNDLEEWMGMIAIGGDLNPENVFVSSYQCDANCTDKGYITAFHISGLFTPKFILELRGWVRENILNKNICQWIGVTVQCFTDAPNLKRLKEKKTFPPEDSLLTFVMNENKNEIVSSSFKSY